MKEIMRNYNENNIQKFFECIDKELKEINLNMPNSKATIS